MIKLAAISTVLAITATVFVSPVPAKAENGQIAAGVLGGLAVGAIVGSQVGRDGYRDNRRGDGYYRARECYIERQDFEDQYGRLRVRNVRVCN